MTPFIKIAGALVIGLTLVMALSSQDATAGISLTGLGDSLRNAMATR